MSLDCTDNLLPADRPTLLLSGLDSLYVSYYFDLRKSRLDFEELSYQKTRLQENRRRDLAELQIGTERFAIMPYGKHPYSFVLSNNAFEVRLGERMSPNCHVQFSSQALWQCGLDDLMNRFASWCGSLLLVQHVPHVIARADWAFDYHLPAIDFTADDFVTRSVKDATHRANRVVQTIAFGRGDVVLRVYDKVAEIDEQSEKFWLYDLWQRRTDVWRIEFQVRRARLHAAGIGTIDELRDVQSDLLRELTTNHTSLRRPSGDSNRARWPVHQLWQALRDDIARLPQTGLVRDIDPRATINMRLYEMGRSIYGMLKGYAALLSERDERGTPLEFGQLLAGLADDLRPHHNTLVWRAEVMQRLQALRLGQW